MGQKRGKKGVKWQKYQNVKIFWYLENVEIPTFVRGGTKKMNIFCMLLRKKAFFIINI